MILMRPAEIVGAGGAGSDAEHAHAAPGHGLRRRIERGPGGVVEPAQSGDRLGAPLAATTSGAASSAGCQTFDMARRSGRRPQEWTSASPSGAAVPSIARGGMEGDLHRIDRDRRAGESARREQRVEAQRPAHPIRARELRPSGSHSSATVIAVLGERSGLVCAQHRGGAHRLDRRGSPGEHADLGDARRRPSRRRSSARPGIPPQQRHADARCRQGSPPASCRGTAR